MQIEVHDPAAEELRNDVQFIKEAFQLLVITGGKPVATIKHIARMEGCAESQLRRGGKERYLLPRFGESGYPTGSCRWDMKEYLEWRAIPREERYRMWKKHLAEGAKRYVKSQRVADIGSRAGRKATSR